MNPRVIKVEASAGAGKTYKLSRRYIDLLLAGAEPSSILAITFTNDATEEMKSRILKLLKEMALKEKSKRAAELVDKLIGDFSRFYVKTIDSFIRSIILASSYRHMEAMPTLEVAHAIPGMLFRKIEETFEENTEEVSELIEALYADGVLTSWNIERKLNEELKIIHEIYSNRNVELEYEDFDKISEEARRLEKNFRKHVKEFLKEFEEWINNNSKNSWLRKLDGPIEDLINAVKFNKWVEKSPPECQKAFYKLLEEKAELIREYLKKHFVSYVKVFHIVEEKMKAEAGKRGIVFLEELNRMADRYLAPESLSELIFYLSEKIDHFLIDEFQDTNRLQWENLRLFVEEAISRGGSLFIVGDSKQAIYSFRGGDYRLFTEFSPKDVGAGLENLDSESLKMLWREEILMENRRSGKAIVDFVSFLFTEKLEELVNSFISAKKESDEPVDLQLIKKVYKDVCQQPETREAGYVEIRTYDEEDKADVVKAIGEEVYSIVEDLLSRGYGFGDIAILFRKNEDVRNLAGYLSLEKGYPVISESSLDIRTNPLVESAYNLLKVLHFPSDDSAFYSFILGDFFQEEEKFEFLRFLEERDRNKPLYIAFRERFEELWKEKFQDLFTLAGFLSPYELASMAVSRFNIFERFPESSVFILHFLELLKDYTDFSDFEEDWETGAEDRFSAIITGKTNAINLLTIHKSKGREFPVVIVPLLGEKKITRTLGKKIVDMNGLMRVKKKDFLKDMSLSEYKRIITDEVLSELNIMYVSFTRAMRELYVLTKEGWVIKPAEYGKKGRGEYKEEKKPVYMHIKTGVWDVRLSERGKQPESFEEKMGNFIHRLLEFLPQNPEKEDFDTAIKMAEADLGYSFEVNDFWKVFELPAVKYVFNQEGTALCEREISLNGEIIKPDRVVITDSEILLLEYKTGKKESEHLEQVKRYKEALSHVYQKPVKAWLVYLTEGEEVQV